MKKQKFVLTLKRERDTINVYLIVKIKTVREKERTIIKGLGMAGPYAIKRVSENGVCLTEEVCQSMDTDFSAEGDRK